MIYLVFTGVNLLPYTTTPGKYIESGPEGGKVSHPVIIKTKKGDSPFPPTQEPNHT